MQQPLAPLLLLLLLLPPRFQSSFTVAALAQEQHGSFYGGSVEWTLVSDDVAGVIGQGTIEFLIRTHWQRSFSAFRGSARDGFAAVGDSLALQGQGSVLFSFGDGSPVVELTGTVTSIDLSLDIVTLLSVTRHSYPASCANFTLTPTYFARKQNSGAGSGFSPPPLIVQEMQVDRTPWLAQLTACCSAPAAAPALPSPSPSSSSGVVIIAAAVDFTFTASSPKLAFPSALLAARINVTFPLLSSSYNGSWPCLSASSQLLSSSSPPSSLLTQPSPSCQWQPELASTSVSWSVASPFQRFALNGSSVTIMGCNGTCAAFLMTLQVRSATFDDIHFILSVFCVKFTCPSKYSIVYVSYEPEYSQQANQWGASSSAVVAVIFTGEQFRLRQHYHVVFQGVPAFDHSFIGRRGLALVYITQHPAATSTVAACRCSHCIHPLNSFRSVFPRLHRYHYLHR